MLLKSKNEFLQIVGSRCDSEIMRVTESCTDKQIIMMAKWAKFPLFGNLIIDISRSEFVFGHRVIKM